MTNAELAEAIEAGMSSAEIADRHGLTRQQVNRRRAALDMSAPVGRPTTAPAPASLGRSSTSTSMGATRRTVSGWSGLAATTTPTPSPTSGWNARRSRGATCRSRAPALEALAAVVVPLLEGRGWHRDPSSHPLHTRRC